VTPTVAKTFYLSDHLCFYDYGNTGTDQRFLPVIAAGGDFFSGTPHIPLSNDLTPFDQTYDLRLSNVMINGQRLITLLQTYNLEGASVEISQLLVNRITTLPIDLTGYVGTEHTVMFRGRVNRVAPITDALITLRCGTELPGMANRWLYATDDAKVAPADVGLRLPIVYGQAKKVQLVSLDIGVVSFLVAAIDASSTADMLVDDITKFPDYPTSMVIQIEDEKIYGFKKSNNDPFLFDVSSRAYEGTIGAAHAAGTPFVVTKISGVIVDNSIYGANSYPSKAINSIYREDPNNARAIRVNEQVFAVAKDLDDDTTITGRNISSVGLNVKGSTIQQPHSTAGSSPQESGYQTESAIDRVGVGYTTPTSCYWASGNNGVFVFENFGTFTSQTIRVTLVEALGDVEVVINAVVIGTISNASLSTTPTEFSFTTTAQLLNTVTLNTVSGGGMKVCNIERTINVVSDTLDQIPIAASTNTGGTAANLYDEDESTGVLCDSTNEYVEVQFAAPGYTYTSQRIGILVDYASGSARWSLKVGTSSPPGTTIFTIGGGQQDSGKVWHYWETPTIGEYVRITQTEANALGTIYEIKRTVITVLDPLQSPLHLRFWADVDGIVAPDTSYIDGITGSLLEHPADIMRHWIEEIGGETVDTASYDALATNLGVSAKWGFDARTLGYAWEEILQRMAFEARCNVIPVETTAGRVWKMLSADIDYGFGTPAASAVITQTHDMTDEGRGIDDLACYFVFWYAHDPTMSVIGMENGYTKALVANPAVSGVPITAGDISDAEDRFGPLQADPIEFRCIQDTATAQDVAGYVVQERIANKRRLFQLRSVAWFDALPYDVGDIVYITAPWASSATICRILSMSKEFESNMWDLTAVEVLDTGTRAS
jgi:hypothetical protein